MLCWFLPYNNANQPQLDIYHLPLEPPSLPSILPLWVITDFKTYKFIYLVLRVYTVFFILFGAFTLNFISLI